MRDYYHEFVGKYSANTHRHEPTKPTKDPSVGFVGSCPNEYGEISDPLVGFVGSVSGEYSEISVVEVPDSEQYGRPARNEIFEERVAIMMHDGGLSEADAIKYLIANPEYTTDFDT